MCPMTKTFEPKATWPSHSTQRHVVVITPRIALFVRDEICRIVYSLCVGAKDETWGPYFYTL